MAIKINDRLSITGNVFDWTVITRFESKDKDGNPKYGEKKHFFPRLSQVASFVIAEEARLAGNAKELCETIQRSTEQVTEVLAGIEERLAEAGVRNSIESIADGEVESNDEKSKAARTESQPKRRTRKKKAS